MFRVSLILSIVAVTALADNCLSPPSVKNFKKEKFAGTWRNHLVVGNTLLGPVPRCLTSRFQGNGNYAVEVSYEQEGKNRAVHGQETDSKDGTFSLNVAGVNIKMVVLDTDYVTYHTVYLCNVDSPKNSTIEVLLRSRERNDALIRKKLKKAQKIIPITAPRVKTDQSACSN